MRKVGKRFRGVRQESTCLPSSGIGRGQKDSCAVDVELLSLFQFLVNLAHVIWVLASFGFKLLPIRPPFPLKHDSRRGEERIENFDQIVVLFRRIFTSRGTGFKLLLHHQKLPPEIVDLLQLLLRYRILRELVRIEQIGEQQAEPRNQLQSITDHLSPLGHQAPALLAPLASSGEQLSECRSACHSRSVANFINASLDQAALRSHLFRLLPHP